MKKILISAFSKPLRNGKRNPKNYPYWKEVVDLLKTDDYKLVQLIFKDEPTIENISNTVAYKSLKMAEGALKESDLFISVDNFLPHMAHFYKKRGIVLWGMSDPVLFGYPENVNLLKSREYLRKRQFDIWEAEEYSPEVFVSAENVANAVKIFDV